MKFVKMLFKVAVKNCKFALLLVGHPFRLILLIIWLVNKNVSFISHFAFLLFWISNVVLNLHLPFGSINEKIYSERKRQRGNTLCSIMFVIYINLYCIISLVSFITSTKSDKIYFLLFSSTVLTFTLYISYYYSNLLDKSVSFYTIETTSSE